LSDDEKKEKEKQNEDLEDFRKWVKSALGDKITRVEVTFSFLAMLVLIIFSM
jgi:HSP90 family molecular chaperone